MEHSKESSKSLNIIRPNRRWSGSYTPWLMVSELWGHRFLIRQLGKRQIIEQYRGSYLGLLWSLLTPLLMLFVYTFVFSVVFQARWSDVNTGSPAEYGLFLFAGLIVYDLFSQMVLGSPNLVISKSNFVKRVVFPVEVFPLSLLTAVFVNSLFSLTILLLGTGIFLRQFSLLWLLLPLLYVPLLFFCLGLSWFLSAVGVFLRDADHFLRILVQLLFFLTPIFYPLTAVPPRFQTILKLNPLTHIVELFRQVTLLNQMPAWSTYLQLTGFCFFVCWLGYAWFMHNRKTFADIL